VIPATEALRSWRLSVAFGQKQRCFASQSSEEKKYLPECRGLA